MPILRWLTALIVVFGGMNLARAAVATRPNIIFILADDLGYGELGCYGQTLIQTPCLDQMAREGIRFTQFYAGATVCAPSRSVLMTGQHHGHTRVRGNAGPKNPEAQRLTKSDLTVAKLLQDSGYRTGLIGKWGLGLEMDAGHPNRQGFDYFFGYLSQHHAHNHYPSYLWRNEEKVNLPNEVVPVGTDGAGYALKGLVYGDDLLTEEALKWIGQTGEQPFFLYLAYVIPHANNERTGALKDGAEVPDYGSYRDEAWTVQNRGQAAMVSRLDSYVGRILRKLGELGLEERTLVIFSSDNGPHRESGNDPAFFHASGPYRGIKRDLSDGGIRVPFIARWPGKIGANRTVGQVGYFGDFMATAAELAQVSVPPGLDSVSLVPTLLGQPERQTQHQFLYWEFHERGFNQAALMDGRWKAIRQGGLASALQIFDLFEDPAELHNVASEQPKIAEQLSAYLVGARSESELWPIRSVGPKENPERKAIQ